MDLLRFSVLEGTEKILGCNLLEESVPRLTLCQVWPFNQSIIPKFSLPTIVAIIQTSIQPFLAISLVLLAINQFFPGAIKKSLKMRPVLVSIITSILEVVDLS